MDLAKTLDEANWLRALARRLVDDDSVVDDVVQTTLCAAWREQERVERRRPWLARVLRNALFEERRRAARRAVREAAVARPEREPSAAEIHERLETQRKVTDAVESLPDPYRSVIVMHYFDGLSLREVAERIDVPIETVRTRHKRAVVRLRERLDESHGGRAAWLLPMLDPDRLRAGLRQGWSVPGVVAVGVAAVLLVSVPWVGSWFQSASEPAPDLRGVAALADGGPSESAAADRGGSDEPDTGMSRVVRSATARLRMTGRIVTAESRAPLSRARVFVERRTPSADWETVGSELGSDRGVFEFECEIAARGGAFRLRVDASDRARFERRFRLARVPRDSRREIHFGELEVARGSEITGLVVDAGHTPVADAEVLLLGSDGSCDVIARTDADGRFAATRRYGFRVDGDDRLVAHTARGTGWTWLDLSRAASKTEVRLALFPSASATVHVEDAAGRPIRGASVAWRPDSPLLGSRWTERSMAPGSPFARRVARITDERGRVELRGLPLSADPARDPQRLVLSVSVGEHRELVGVRAVSGHNEFRHVWHGPFEDARDVAETSSERLGSLLGRVVDEAGHPIEGARVELHPAVADGALTDITGAFHLDRVPRGAGFRIEVTPPSPAHAWLGRRATRVDAFDPRSDPIELRLTAAAGVDLAVAVRDRDGRPLDVRRCMLRPVRDGALGEMHPVRCRIGSVEASQLPPGTWSLIVVSTQGHTVPRIFEVLPSASRVEFDLTPMPIASVVGEIDWSRIPAADRDRAITIAHSFAETPALWVDPETGGPLGPGSQVVDMPNMLRLEPGVTKFRLDGLTSFRGQIDVFVTDSGALLGGLEIPLSPGKRTRVRIPVTRAATARFEWDGPPAAQDLQLWYRTTSDDPAEGRWERWVSLVRVPRGSSGILEELPLRPGRYEWAVSPAGDDPVGNGVGASAFRFRTDTGVLINSGGFEVGVQGAAVVGVTVR